MIIICLERKVDAPLPGPNIHKRELEVITLLSYSLSSKEIADQLHISKSTVDNHRKNLLRKTGCSNSIGVVAWAVHNGLISPPQEDFLSLSNRATGHENRISALNRRQTG